ncbi:MAG TPA: family 16 glycosylhydrolase [Cyclobacteriaceae bacterium]|nr:family 16 glycosylhydrolase [Cyclobacteriaceae bacterium]
MLKKIIFTILLFCFVYAKQLYAQCPVLVWSDEFDGSGLPNPDYWTFDLGQSGWGNQEIQNYTNNLANVRQEDGKLIIDAFKTGTTWTSARVKTQNRISFTYGKIVFRAKLPTGVGTWPALWLLGNNISTVGWPACGEIDVMEHIGRNQNVIMAAIHNSSSFGNTVNKGQTINNTASTEFHEYAISWNKDRIIFYVNDVPYYTYNPANKTNATWPFDLPHFLIMNLAIGGTLGGAVDPNLSAARMEIDYVRVYEERPDLKIEGKNFVFENQKNLVYTAPDYGEGITYNWTVPDGANIVSGQGTNEIKVEWGTADGTINLTVEGETGCTNNSTSFVVSTIVNPTGLRYTIEDFSNTLLNGWSKNNNGINYEVNNNRLAVNYSVNSLSHIQYNMPKAVNLSDFGIIKIPIAVTQGATLPKLLLTLRDGEGNETITTNFDIPITRNDGNTYTFTYNFDGQWSSNNPPVNPESIKALRIYKLSGQSSFQIGNINAYNSKSLPVPPENLSVSITEQGEIALFWEDNTNATSFNLYRSNSADGNYTKIQSDIKTHEMPLIINQANQVSYYKLSGVNANGESDLSTAIEIVASITSVEESVAKPLAVFPNPSNGSFFIQGNDQEIYSLNIFNALGKKQAFTSNKSNELLQVDLTDNKPGIYFIVFNQSLQTYVAKVLVQ